MEKKILLVEDDVGVQRAISTLLNNYGYTVINSLNGEMALSILEEEIDNIGLIISDINMPGMGGQALIEKISEMKNDIPIIVYSAVADEYLHLEKIKSVKAIFNKTEDYSGLKNAIVEHYIG